MILGYPSEHTNQHSVFEPSWQRVTRLQEISNGQQSGAPAVPGYRLLCISMDEGLRASPSRAVGEKTKILMKFSANVCPATALPRDYV